MSILFFVIVAAMVLVAMAWVLPALLRKQATGGIDRDRQNIELARERLAELDIQAAAGQLSTEELEAARAEVESTLLEDVAVVSEGLAQNSQKTSATNWSVAVIAAGVPIVAGLLYLTLGMPRAFLHGADAQVAVPQGHPQLESERPASVEELVAKVEQRLQQNPNDAQGWEILANTYMALKRYADAANALAKHMALVGEQPELLVRRADALAMSREGELAGEPEKLLHRALELDSNHPTGLWLSGIAAARRGDAAAALKFLRKAQPLFADKPESAAALRQQIAEAEKSLGITEAPAQSEQATPKVTTVQAPMSVVVKVSLDKSLGQQVSADDTVFILARAVNGPRMPLAVARKTVKDLPVEVRLDDSMAMMPKMKLSNFKTVELIARVSKSGNAIAQSGDLVGKNGPLSLPIAEPVAISISQRVP